MDNISGLIKNAVVEKELKQKKEKEMLEDLIKKSGAVEVLESLAKKLSSKNLTTEENKLKEKLLNISGDRFSAGTLPDIHGIFDSFYVEVYKGSCGFRVKFKIKHQRELKTLPIFSASIFASNQNTLNVYIHNRDGESTSLCSLKLPCSQEEILTTILSKIV